MMSESDFWELVGAGSGAQPEEQCATIEQELCRHEAQKIVDFADRLAEILFRLDRKALADVPITGVVSGSGRPVKQSEDRFLYARCAVVLAGPEAVTRVLAHPEEFSPFTSDEAAASEELLEVAATAFEEVTGEEWDHIEPYDYETGSNAEGWR